MRRGEVLALVQAGGKGSRMDVLTRERAKPVLPFAGVHRLIDFPMSALLHAGIEDVWVSVQYQSSSMDQYLSGGRPWDLDRNRGGFRRLVPQTGNGPSSTEGCAHGNADLLVRIGDDLAAFGASTLVVSSADHVFNADLVPVIEEHVRSGAAATLLTCEVTKKEAVHNVVVTAEDGVVAAVDSKPDSPPHGVVATEIFIYQVAPLMAAIADMRRAHASTTPGEDTGLGDFADVVLPELLRRHEVRAIPIEGYWRDVGRPEVYLQAHRDLLSGRVDVFDHPARPVLAHWQDRIPARFRAGAEVADSMVSPGCDVGGEVVDSVLGCGVVVGKGAVVRDCVIMDDVIIEPGARVSTSIVDTRSVIAQGAEVGELASGRVAREEQITLVGKESHIGRRQSVDAGARLEPGTSVGPSRR